MNNGLLYLLRDNRQHNEKMFELKNKEKSDLMASKIRENELELQKKNFELKEKLDTEKQKKELELQKIDSESKGKLEIEKMQLEKKLESEKQQYQKEKDEKDRELKSKELSFHNENLKKELEIKDKQILLDEKMMPYKLEELKEHTKKSLAEAEKEKAKTDGESERAEQEKQKAEQQRFIAFSNKMITDQKCLETFTGPHQEGTNTLNHSVKAGSFLFIIGILLLICDNQKDSSLLLTVIGLMAIISAPLTVGLGYHRARELDKQAALSRASLLNSHKELQLQTFIPEQRARGRQSRLKLQHNEDSETKYSQFT